ncbi:VanZ family protein [Arthrobacter sp. MPF02]|uniref:VanZ family protein n=1 Tax=Arthrobacter sp. MPF02 TaxID=3388492 RepID=UPI003984C55C
MKLLQNRDFWQVMLFVMLVAVAFVAFWPNPIDQPVQGQLAAMLNVVHRHGIPHWFDYNFVEASANVALFIPIGVVSALAFPEKCWMQIAASGLLISSCMELGQLLFLNNRFASLVDIMTNTSGAVLGALVAFLVFKKK